MTAGLGLGAVFVDIVPSLANAMDSMKTGGSDAANAFAGAFAESGKGNPAGGLPEHHPEPG
jgi:hypothetical protein